MENDVVKDYLDGVTPKEIFEKYNIKRGRFYGILKKHDIKLRTHAEALKIAWSRGIKKCGEPSISKDELYNLYYNDKLSLRDIGKKFNASETFTKHWLKHYNLKPRELSEASKLRCVMKPQSNPGRKGMPKNPNYGKYNHAYKGGYIRQDGYKLISVMGEQRLEHRYIWEKQNGQIPYGYQIHHINEDKLDNRIENFQLLKNSEHQKLHNQLRNSKDGRFMTNTKNKKLI